MMPNDATKLHRDDIRTTATITVMMITIIMIITRTGQREKIIKNYV